MEIDRLRKRVRELEEERDKLKAELAEARGLLAKCLDWLSEYTDSELVTGIKAALAGEGKGKP